MAWLNETPGLTLNWKFTAGNWPIWFTLSGATVCFSCATACERHHLALARANVEIAQRRRIALILRQNLEDNVVFVRGRLDGGDPAISISIVQRIRNLVGSYADRERAVPIDIDVEARAAQPQIAEDIL